MPKAVGPSTSRKLERVRAGGAHPTPSSAASAWTSAGSILISVSTEITLPGSSGPSIPKVSQRPAERSGLFLFALDLGLARHGT